MNIDQILNEVKRFKDQNPKVLNAAIMSNEILLNRYAKLVPRIRGEFATVQSLLGHVVMQFRPQWDEVANTQFRGKQLRNFHQKVNFAFTPAEILGSWIEQKYNEGVELKDKEISRHIMTMLKAKIISDVNILSVTGVYNAATPTVFGASMDGVNRIHTLGLANEENPFFKIPTDAIDDTNIGAVLLEFEKRLPEQMKPFIKGVKMSVQNAENYQLWYEDTFGKNTNFSDGKGLKTRLGNRQIIPVPNMSNNHIVATVDGNFTRMVDVIENPATITDVQKLDYKLKVFGEFTLGYDYAVNELVIINDPVGEELGLGDADLNKLFYPESF
ncbi:MAG: hypothetical protein J0M25_00730 [Flavobacteriales bacterium]|nr:hypothetical protein [Flavobacteriales bacterium]